MNDTRPAPSSPLHVYMLCAVYDDQAMLFQTALLAPSPELAIALFMSRIAQQNPEAARLPLKNLAWMLVEEPWLRSAVNILDGQKSEGEIIYTAPGRLN